MATRDEIMDWIRDELMGHDMIWSREDLTPELKIFESFALSLRGRVKEKFGVTIINSWGVTIGGLADEIISLVNEKKATLSQQ